LCTEALHTFFARQKAITTRAITTREKDNTTTEKPSTMLSNVHRQQTGQNSFLSSTPSFLLVLWLEKQRALKLELEKPEKVNATLKSEINTIRSELKEQAEERERLEEDLKKLEQYARKNS